MLLSTAALLPDMCNKLVLDNGTDALARHDMELHQRTTPEEKLAQALELTRVGIRLQRTKLAHRYPSETDEQIEKRLLDWLQVDD